MGTMVYRHDYMRRALNGTVEDVLRLMLADGAKFTGARSFVWWETAVAYALLPASPTLTVTGRRRVTRGSSGRWVVQQTSAPRELPHPFCANPFHQSGSGFARLRCPECRPETADIPLTPGAPALGGR